MSQARNVASSDVPLVSVCIPTIGRMKYLPLTQASLEAQTLTDLEVLILDNASGDDAQRQLGEWAERDPRVRILRSDERLPMFRNFNRGIAAARGRFVAFFHDDDLYLPDFLRRHAEFLDRHPEVGFVGSNHDFIDGEGKVKQRRRWIRKSDVWPGRRYIRDLMRRGRNILAMQGIVFRRGVLEGGFDEQISLHYGDFVILMRIAEHWNVGVLEEPLVQVRHHDAQASKGISFVDQNIIRSDCMRQYCEEYRQRWPGDKWLATDLALRLAFADRFVFLWGWMAAKTDEEARVSLEHFGNTLPDRALRKLLRTADGVGIDPVHRRSMALWLSRLSNVIGV